MWYSINIKRNYSKDIIPNKYTKIKNSNLNIFDYMYCSFEDDPIKCEKQVNNLLEKNINNFDNKYFLYNITTIDWNKYIEYISKKIESNGNSTEYIIDIFKDWENIPETINEYIWLALYICPNCWYDYMIEEKDIIKCNKCNHITDIFELEKRF